MKRFLIAVALAVSAGLSFALPTVPEVEAQVQQGHYAQAETMMKEVVAAKPGSARAHYVYAEILAHNGRVAEATAEAERARVLDPALSFTSDPQKFRTFERMLQQQGRPGTSAATAGTAGSTAPDALGSVAAPAARARAEPASSGVPSWIWIAGLAVVGFFLWRAFSRSRAAGAGLGGAAGSASASGPYPGGPQGPGYGPGYGPQGGYGPGGAPVGRGGGLLGAGLAGAGGFAAGMLADRLLHGRDGQPAAGHDALSGLGPNGTDDTVRFDDPGAGGLASRDVDFGAGGDDWGGDAGSVDVGGGDGGWDT